MPAEHPINPKYCWGVLLNLSDTAHSWVLMADGSYQRHKEEPFNKKFSCHKFFMENPSMSGRGRAGSQDVPRLLHSIE